MTKRHDNNKWHDNCSIHSAADKTAAPKNMVPTDKAAQPAIVKAERTQAEMDFIEYQKSLLQKAEEQMLQIQKAGLWEVWQANTNYRVRESIKTLAKNILAETK